MESELIVGLIYSKFDPRIGPKAFVSIPPDLSKEITDLVSLKAINMFAGEKGAIPESLAIIPFTSFDLKGLTKCIRIIDESKRGGFTDSAITLIFDESNDVIFYKYIKNLEVFFTESAKKIVKFEEEKADSTLISKEINQLYLNLINILEELRDREISTSVPEEKGKFTVPEKDFKEYCFKIIVCGDPAVGKTSTVLRFTDHAFSRSYMPTIGVNVSEKRIIINDVKIDFLVWDIAGHHRFEMMRKHFYTGTEGILLVFDLTNPQSFENISYWYDDIKKHIKNKIPGILVGNKKDLKEQRKLKRNEILKTAKRIGYEYVETSALTGENIKELFNKLGEKIYRFREDA
ncbi:MAG: Rab family GTPase [Candidatus Helarchaeota archaeon]